MINKNNRICTIGKIIILLDIIALIFFIKEFISFDIWFTFASIWALIYILIEVILGIKKTKV